MSAAITAKWAKGSGDPAGDETQNLTGGNYGPEMPMVVASTLRSHPRPGSNSDGATAFHMIQDPVSTHERAPALGGRSDGMGLYRASGVRRLTPVECERLQGFPDDWTRVPGLKCPDSRRYGALGNAVTVNVAEWIGRRVLACCEADA